jgi:KAP family P-loop domain.
MKIKKTMSKNNWSEDKLERKEIASFLTNYLTKRYSITSQRDKPDSLVMSFRADWGFGKTFFLNRWAKDLKDLDYPVVR